MYTTPAPLKPSVADTDGTDASRDENRVFRTVRSTSYRQPPLFRSKRSRSPGEGRRERRETTNVAWKPEEQGVLVIERGLPAICLSLKLQRLPPKAAEFRTGKSISRERFGGRRDFFCCSFFPPLSYSLDVLSSKRVGGLRRTKSSGQKLLFWEGFVRRGVFLTSAATSV